MPQLRPLRCAIPRLHRLFNFDGCPYGAQLRSLHTLCTSGVAHTIASPAGAAATVARAAVGISIHGLSAEVTVAKSKQEPVYRVIDVIGTSATSWEDAAKRAVETAAGSLRDLRVAEIEKLDMRVENGKVVAYRARVQLSFKYES